MFINFYGVDRSMSENGLVQVATASIGYTGNCSYKYREPQNAKRRKINKNIFFFSKIQTRMNGSSKMSLAS